MPKPVQLVNRGPAGLLNSLPKTANALPAAVDVDLSAAKKDNIQCDGEIVRLDQLVPDAMNARLHPDRNIKAICESLALYGQRKPLVVRRQNMQVAAGNGTLEAMTKLGWTIGAASIRDMTDEEFYGFALADNRTAELAKWDFETVAKIDTLIRELGGGRMPGWTMDELEVLRAADWTPPVIDDSVGQNGGAPEKLELEFSETQSATIREAVARYREEVNDWNRDEADCLTQVCSNWLAIIGSRAELNGHATSLAELDFGE